MRARFSAVILRAAAGALLTLSMVSTSSAAMLATWTFETSIPATAGPLAAESGAGSALGVHASGATVYSSPAGNGSAHSFSSNTWAVNDYYQFSATTGAGNNNYTITWDEVASNTGPKDFALSYSTDGISYAPVISYVVLANAAPNSWSAGTPVAGTSYSASISSVPTSPTIFFRMVNSSTVSANGGTVAAGGTNRVDNVVINGTTVVPEPATLALAGIALVGVVAIRRRG
jgi:PEP-CTERM motif